MIAPINFGGPFCARCKHSTVDYECALTPEALSLVYGTVEHRSCADERSEKGQCGPAGKNFEPDDCDTIP